MTLNVSWNSEPNKISHSSPITLKYARNTDLIYSDNELNEMICAERILEIDSVTDKTVIACLCGGKSVTEIAAATHGRYIVDNERFTRKANSKLTAES